MGNIDGLHLTASARQPAVFVTLPKYVSVRCLFYNDHMSSGIAEHVPRSSTSLKCLGLTLSQHSATPVWLTVALFSVSVAELLPDGGAAVRERRTAADGGCPRAQSARHPDHRGTRGRAHHPDLQAAHLGRPQQ